MDNNKEESLLVKVTNIMKSLGDTFYHGGGLVVARANVDPERHKEFISVIKNEYSVTTNVYTFDSGNITILQVRGMVDCYLQHNDPAFKRVAFPTYSRYFVITPEFVAIVLDDTSQKFDEDGYLVISSTVGVTATLPVDAKNGPIRELTFSECLTVSGGISLLNESDKSNIRPDFVPTSLANGIIKGKDELITALSDELVTAHDAKDAAYLERNKLIALLSTLFPSGIKKTAIEGWSEEWHNCVYIDLPHGQASWHYHDSQVDLFKHLPPYEGEWDGHTTEEKYQGIMDFVTRNSDPNKRPIYIAKESYS